MASPSEFRKAYETAKRQLAELIAEQERLERRKLTLRQTIEALASQCEGDQIPIDPSPEAAYLLEHVTLADEIRTILRARYPESIRPNNIKSELERLGHDLRKYSNPQATIHMVLKRLVEAKDAEEMKTSDGKQIYRASGLMPLSVMRAKTKK